MKQLTEHLPAVGEVTFEDWYKGYPKKANKKKAKALWDKLSEKNKNLAALDVPKRAELHSQWQTKEFVPAPDVYLRNEKWTDEIVQAKTKEEEQEELEDGTPLSRFWTLFKQTYGDNRVKHQYGLTMPWMWRKQLAQITNNDIAKILSYLQTHDDGLPTLPRIMTIWRIGREEIRTVPLIDNPTKPETVSAAVAEMKEFLK